LVAQGFTNQATALQLKVSVKTVEKHRASLMEKLHVHDTASLVRVAIRQGLIFLDDAPKIY
jgi:DNA-binding NarL/FixJ family response regulator